MNKRERLIISSILLLISFMIVFDLLTDLGKALCGGRGVFSLERKLKTVSRLVESIN